MLGKSKKEPEIPEEAEQSEEMTALQEQANALGEELLQTKDLLLRRTAELENMRRRHEQERTQLIFEANKRLVTELLGTVDDLERTLASIKPEEKNPVAEGVELVYKNFIKVLERNGVAPLEAVGTQFDFNLHDALMEEPRTDIEPGTITTEVQKGYKMNDTILRHSKVIVAKSPDSE
jgi:molecular chaperone GrpE